MSRWHRASATADSDPLAREIEALLVPEDFVTDRAMFGFVAELGELRDRIVAVGKGGEFARAAGLLETFIAAADARSDPMDDSSGSFGRFIGELALDWIRAQQGAGAAPSVIVATLERRRASDAYGHFWKLRAASFAVLDAAGVALVEASLRHTFETAPRTESAWRSAVDDLLALHSLRGDVDGYAATCESAGGADANVDATDCEKLARMCLEQGDLQAALAWTERGLAPSSADSDHVGCRPPASGWELVSLRRKLLVQLGRAADARDDAWAEYRRVPTLWNYRKLMEFVAAADADEWRARALQLLLQAELRSAAEISVALGEIEPLIARLTVATDAEVARLVFHLDDGLADGIVAAVRGPCPEQAARVATAAALGALASKRTSTYPAAACNLAVVRDLLAVLGRGADWQALVAAIRSLHGRKSAFMPAFERVVRGEGPEEARRSESRSYLDEARERWRRKMEASAGSSADVGGGAGGSG